MYFCFIVIFSPWKKAGPLMRTNFNPLYRKILCAKFGWNWPSVSGEEDEYVKSLRQRQRPQQRQRRQRRTTDKFWSEKVTWAFGSGELINIVKFECTTEHSKISSYCYSFHTTKFGSEVHEHFKYIWHHYVANRFARLLMKKYGILIFHIGWLVWLLL